MCRYFCEGTIDDFKVNVKGGRRTRTRTWARTWALVLARALVLALALAFAEGWPHTILRANYKTKSGGSGELSDPKKTPAPQMKC